MNMRCVNCGKSREIGRRRCQACHREQARNRAKARYALNGRYSYRLVCHACKQTFSGSRAEQQLCSSCWGCYNELRRQRHKVNPYVYCFSDVGTWEHQLIAARVLGRKLRPSEVVHHVDMNPRNNAIDNLMVMSRSTHGKLHIYLDVQRVILEKSGNENFENCWNSLIAPLTTAWFEKTGAMVIKLAEIGQSAAEFAQ